MTLQEFITKYNGKKVDFDGHYGAQCMDLYRYYVEEVWQKPQTPAVKSAYMVFDTIDPTQYDKFTSGELKIGDVVVWNNKFGPDGHIAIVENPSDPKSLVVFGQNDPVGAPSKLSRHTYANILGWFRPKNPLAKTFMAVTLVVNKNNNSSLSQLLELTKQKFLEYSDNKFEPVFNIIHTDFNNIPYSPPVPGMPLAVDVNWYRQNITPLTNGQATIFLINPEDYYPGLQWGFMSWGDQGRPIRIEVVYDPNPEIFWARIFHELGGHGLEFLTGQPDITHQLLYQNPPRNRDLMNYIDQLKLQQALVKIK